MIWYPSTPALSVEAPQARLICEDDVAVAVSPPGTDGGVRSAGLSANICIDQPLLAVPVAA